MDIPVEFFQRLEALLTALQWAKEYDVQLSSWTSEHRRECPICSHEFTHNAGCALGEMIEITRATIEAEKQKGKLS